MLRMSTCPSYYIDQKIVFKEDILSIEEIGGANNSVGRIEPGQAAKNGDGYFPYQW